MREAATAFASVVFEFATRNTFQWQFAPVIESVWEKGTIWSVFNSFETWLIANAIAPLRFPRSKSTLSRLISLRAFSTAVPVSTLVKSSNSSSTERPRIPPLLFISSTASSQPICSFLPYAA